MTPIRVLVADDDPRLRASLTLLIDGEPDMAVAGAVPDGAAALAAVRDHEVDVVLMDVRMPVMDGLDATRAILGAGGPGPRVIVLTMFDADQYVYEALRAGASGFLLKNAPPASLVQAVRAARAGDALLAPEVTRRLIGRFALSPRRDDPRIARLTSREREALCLIGRGMSNDEIARHLFVTPTTVRTYVSRILAKTGARDRAQLVVIAYECGLVSPGQD
ncbi:response regulator [Brachybacterium hainanense]|uniref:Response regulator n=1 Tax=Brachybacterium hainanense TaxID=1541174 RepID=A0ABV6RA35_9MICO